MLNRPLYQAAECPSCGGYGVVACPYCDGTANLLVDGENRCRRCKGVGFIDCRRCKPLERGRSSEAGIRGSWKDVYVSKLWR